MDENFHHNMERLSWYNMDKISIQFLLALPNLDATDEALKLQIAITLNNKKKEWTMENRDIEAAFIEADKKNELFIEPHPAMVICGFMTEEERKKFPIKLEKSMYGNIDAAIKFLKTLIEVTTEEKGMRMQQSQVDPCLLYLHEDDELKLIVTIAYDDCAVSGHPDNGYGRIRESFSRHQRRNNK